MKVYLVQTYNLRFHESSVKAIHRTREGAIKKMKRQAYLEIMQDPALTSFGGTDDHIVLGYERCFAENEKVVIIYVNEMEVQE